jgi:preprotein translocase subunit SecA
LLDPEFDIGSKIRENRAEYIDHLLAECEIFEGAPKEDFNIEKLSGLIKEELTIDIPTELLEGKERDEIFNTVTDILEKQYEEKMSVINPDQRSEIESVLYLRVLDPEWRDHLYEMDVLKTGIGLRGYNQKDPLTEYKQDSYKLFQDLIQRIKFEAVKILHLVQFDFGSEEEEQQAVEEIKNELESSIEETTLNQSFEEGTIAEPIPDQVTKPITGTKKPKRNDPCPCGSGKKYKNCCGKSGPKKGLLA